MPNLRRGACALSAALAAVVAFAGAAPSQQLLTPESLAGLLRVGELALSPDGAHLLYTVRTPDLLQNRSAAVVWLLPTAPGSKGRPVAEGSSPVWLPAGTGGASRFAVVTKDGVVVRALADAAVVATLPGAVANLSASPAGD
ncbi:MAG: hypothetical protein JNL12_14375, partial [Planctomycetes bacterium]|nr:hypothetical protein [Planctomycetota bacterium]